MHTLNGRLHELVRKLDALNKLESQTYDVVLMDVPMPKMDGFAATRAIREKERHSGVQLAIIAMTAHANDAQRSG
jgi:two-component system sensor histidine kinase/response regulator